MRISTELIYYIVFCCYVFKISNLPEHLPNTKPFDLFDVESMLQCNWQKRGHEALFWFWITIRMKPTDFMVNKNSTNNNNRINKHIHIHSTFMYLYVLDSNYRYLLNISHNSFAYIIAFLNWRFWIHLGISAV